MHEGGKGPSQGRGAEEQATEGRVARRAVGEPVSGGCSQRQRQWKVREDRAGWRVVGEATTPGRGEASQAQGLTPCHAAQSSQRDWTGAGDEWGEL